MKVNVLQQYLRNLAETLALSDGQSRVPGDLREACNLLASLGEMEVGQLGELLRQAQEYRATRDLAIPRFLRPTVTAYDGIQSLKTRASSPEVNREDLVRDLEAVLLDTLTRDELVALVKELGWTVKEKASKNDAIGAIWQGVTGSPKPKKRAAPRQKTPSAPFPVEEYAQKITALKERAHAPDSTREELEQSLKQLELNKFNKDNLVDLARQLSCDVNPKTKKADALKAIERVVLVVKELMVSTLS
jgi:hypothetical protein